MARLTIARGHTVDSLRAISSKRPKGRTCKGCPTLLSVWNRSLYCWVCQDSRRGRRAA